MRTVPFGVFTSKRKPGQRHLDRPRRDVGGRVDGVGDRPLADLDERGPARIVHVDHARRVGRQHLEQPALGGEVRLHVFVEVEVIARQVAEHAGGEAHAVDALQRQRVRRDFHHRGAAALLQHLAQQLLHVGRFRRGARGFAILAADAVGDGAEHAGAKAGGVEDRREQVRRRGLAVRAGDADDRHAPARVIEEAIGEQRQRQPRIANGDPGNRRACPGAAIRTRSPPRRARPPARRTRRRRRAGP